MIELAASETTVLIAVGAATALVFALGTLIIIVAVFAVFDGSEEAVRDVQRFVELTEEARSLLPRGPALADPNGRPAPRSDGFSRRRRRRVEPSGGHVRPHQENDRRAAIAGEFQALASTPGVIYGLLPQSPELATHGKRAPRLSEILHCDRACGHMSFGVGLPAPVAPSARYSADRGERVQAGSAYDVRLEEGVPKRGRRRAGHASRSQPRAEPEPRGREAVARGAAA